MREGCYWVLKITLMKWKVNIMNFRITGLGIWGCFKNAVPDGCSTAISRMDLWVGGSLDSGQYENDSAAKGRDALGD